MASTSVRDWPASALVAARLVSLAVIVAALYWGQAVLVPLVLAALIAFLLSPLVTRLDRLRVPRVVGVVLVMALVGGAIGGVGYVVTGQLRSFADELPAHRANIRAKIRDLVALTRGGAIENVQETIEDINAVVESQGDSAAAAATAEDERVRVAVEDSQLFGNSQVLGPLFGAVGTLGLTLLLAMFMLVGREDLRNRLVSLSGRASLVVTTKAFADAGDRISRYLLMQFIVNATMGVAVGAGLYFIGVPYAALWGLGAALLRYVPYVGPWVAALLPITVSLVTAPGWEQVAIVVGMFVVLELLSNNVMEPMLYGRSVGLSSLAVIVAAVFWTWLWGPIGLVIATPITACLVVLASYVPALDAIGRLLGEQPALPPDVSLYQRLLARDLDEADEIIDEYQEEHSLEETCELVLKTLLALKRDRHDGRVAAEDGEFVRSSLRELIEELPGPEASGTGGPARSSVLVLGVPVRDGIDALALELAGVLLRGEPVTLEVLSPDMMVGEAIAAIEAKTPAAVVVPSLPPTGLAPARHLTKRLHARVPGLTLVAARLGDPDAAERAPRLVAAGSADVPASLAALKVAILAAARNGAQRAVRGAAPVAAPTVATAARGG